MQTIKYENWTDKVPKEIWDLDEETENLSDNYRRLSETPDNAPKQVWSIFSTKKKLKNKGAVTVDQEINRNSSKAIWNH